ncbi:hypothetical protein WNY51_01685 [Pseudocolwellia sp. AS88]|uniref:hypothetical protein n=1 Tax=Pseudocolwellia sp. AS88 TaxID=3063958 RepID=UPI0026ED6D44|nr:hypothetical protein [Pseudocolwellia sp. AS88]MDO7084660.1 hypothetical protein [Pseudocolwellia sp. AS88]
MAKKTHKALLFSMLCSTIFTALVSTKLYAAETDKLTIEVMSDAKVFAKLDDELPAVVNYFTKRSENSILAFYEEKYGKAISSNRKRGHLENSFINNNHNITVIVSERNNQRQVDVMVTKSN